jgi:hypothetical protein
MLQRIAIKDVKIVKTGRSYIKCTQEESVKNIAWKSRVKLLPFSFLGVRMYVEVVSDERIWV